MLKVMNEESKFREAESLEQSAFPQPVTADPASATSTTPNGSHRTGYAVAAGVLLILTLILIGFFLTRSKPDDVKITPTPITINTQTLDSGTLTKLTIQSGAAETRQQLTISPETLFKNGVTVQGALRANQSLEVGGTLDVQKSVTLRDSVSIGRSLVVRGSVTVGGVLSASSLNVGTLSVASVDASGSLNFGGHLVPRGPQPSAKSSVATSGGTVTVSGNDTAGTVTITVGNGQLNSGELAIITFTTPFTTTPKVQLTPINAASAKITYYASRNSGFFTIETATIPTTDASYVFDYLVTQ